MKYARTVIACWLAVLGTLAMLAIFAGGNLTNDFQIPSTEAQRGLDELSQRLPEFSGTTAQIVFKTVDHSSVANYKPQIKQVLNEAEKLPGVRFVASPFQKELDRPAVSKDGSTAIAQVNFKFGLDKIPPEVKTILESLHSPDKNLEIHVGGQLFGVTEVQIGITELAGVGVALVILIITFRSVKCSLIPIISAGLGVGVAMSALFFVSRFFAISTTTPSLAVMLGLAVGIDYALFIVFRHRVQLAAGENVNESIARAVGTSGSAVIFAGSTVIVALLGLAVAHIPFLTVMGIAAAFAVAVAVAMAVTWLPAVLALMGERLRPKGKQPIREHWWVRFTTRYPLPVIVLVIIFAFLTTTPAADLRLALPDNGTMKVGTVPKDTYDLVRDQFGPGANAPLILIGDIVQSHDPLGLMDKWKRQVATIAGVKEVKLATPNRDADLGVIVLEPEGSQESAQTEQLVNRLRANAKQWEDELAINNIRVTGMTAAAIDISKQLGAALAPFTLIVVGLSLVLLMFVFRSIWVPIKATLGYLVSVGVAFGVTAAVFIWGWGNSALHIYQIGPVICFMPIMVMGVLFGLAMDYEVFLVSRMSEEYVHGATPLNAIQKGYDTTAPVVTAAALIMIAVFAGFVPGGTFHVQPIAFGLAVGVFVDAFIVRMTMVPAALSLLGRHAWYLPQWIKRHIPRLDIEGESLGRRLAFEHLEVKDGPILVRVCCTPELIIRPGDCVRLRGKQKDVITLINAICARREYPCQITVAGCDTRDEATSVQALTCILNDPRYINSQLQNIEQQAERGRAIVVFVTNGCIPDPDVLLKIEHVGGATVFWNAAPHRQALEWEVRPCDYVISER